MVPFPDKPNIDVTDEMVKQVSVYSTAAGKTIIFEVTHKAREIRVSTPSLVCLLTG